jgi:hypothetical protein
MACGELIVTRDCPIYAPALQVRDQIGGRQARETNASEREIICCGASKLSVTDSEPQSIPHLNSLLATAILKYLLI